MGYSHAQMNPNDTRLAIWDIFYLVSVPSQGSRSIEDIRRYGTPVSGVTSIDRDIQNQWMTMEMAVHTMVDYFMQGVPVRVLRIQDAKTIYEAITRHIYAWKTKISRQLNVRDAPYEELNAMDSFAQSLFEHIKHEYTDKDFSTANNIYFDSFSEYSNDFIKPGVLERLTGKQSPEVKTEEPVRESLGEFFTSNAHVNRRR